MTRRTDEQWSRLWFDGASLMADSAAVIGLRTLAIMKGGPAAARECEQMVSEKAAASLELAATLASGRVLTSPGAARAALRIAGKRVRANRRRLG